MLNYSLVKQPGKPLYDELYKAIRNDILKGRLRSGQRLPSKRDMAADNSLSVTTVLNAYQQLLMEGYLVSEEKKGYFVADEHPEAFEAYESTFPPKEKMRLPGQLFYDGVMETNRIILRPWRDSDAAALYKWASDPDVGPRAGWAPHKSPEESLDVIRTVFKDATNTWAIELKKTGEAIGAMGYGPSCDCKLPAREGEPLAGYWVAKPYWNRGICTEALKLMIEHIRLTTDIKSLISGHFVDNPASGRVMEKCGFVPTGETVIDGTQYQGAGRPIRVLRLQIR